MKIQFDTYKPQYKTVFKDLNLEWLNTYFYVEPHDEEVLSKPEKYILDPGGHILVALVDDQPAGVVALMPIEENIYELTKMAVDKQFRGLKIGQQLMEHCLAFAKSIKTEKLILYSNRKLENAIHIYRKYGFEEIALEEGLPYERADIKMEKIL